MPTYKSRSSSVDTVLREQPCSWFKNVFRGSKTNRHHKRNKSEKSVHSQTDVNRLLQNNDSGVQCSEHFLKTETTRNSLLEFYIKDISEKCLTKSDFLVIENQKKKLVNPMKIFNQILQDVMSHFPEIEISLKNLTMGLIDEFCLNFVRLQVFYLKQMISKETENRQNVVHLYQDVESRNETIPSPSSYDHDIENIMETISICGNNYKCNQYLLKHFNHDQTINKRFHRRIRKRYVVKKSKHDKNSQHTNLEADEDVQTRDNIQIEEPQFLSASDDSNFNKFHESLTNVISKEGRKELSNNKQCTISISPFNITSSNKNSRERIMHENHESRTEKRTEYLSEKTSCNPAIMSMARGDELDVTGQNLKYFSFSEKCEKDNKKYFKNSRNLETFSLNLDCEILPGSSEYQEDFEQNVSGSVSINTEDETFQTELDWSNNPAEVSVIYTSDSSPQPERLEFRNFVDISNSNNYFRSPAKLNLFCESLYEKFSLREPENHIYHCDTEMSVSTKFTKLPDQTVSMSNVLSNPSDTICEVMTDKCVGDSSNEKQVKSRFSVKFMENFSKEINRKNQLNSSFLKHTIASKMKIKNQDPVQCRKRDTNL